MRIEANMHQAKTDLSKLVARALEGDEVIIMRNGTPVVKLVPFTEGRRVLGQARGQVWVSPDFDDPLPDDLLRAFYGIGVDDMLGERSDEVPDWLVRKPGESSAPK